jgi:PadR family transcriptional regulator, regulatory protein PadR
VARSGIGKESTPLDHECFVKQGPQKRFIEPRLLFLIRRSPCYGYEMIEQMADLPFPGLPPDSAAVYRMLRELERQGLARSEWQPGEAGPSKRIYKITPAGEARLEAWLAALKERVRILNRFIRLCEKGS